MVPEKSRAPLGLAVDRKPVSDWAGRYWLHDRWDDLAKVRVRQGGMSHSEEASVIDEYLKENL